MKDSTTVGGVSVAQAALEGITAHAEEIYPYECFGFLLGQHGQSCIRVARPGRNVDTVRAHDRYEMDPQEFLQAQLEAEKWGGEIVGFYHSHPDGTAIPSAYDRERAWEEYLYLIVPVAGGRAGTVRLWQLQASEGSFLEITMHIVKGGSADQCL